MNILRRLFGRKKTEPEGIAPLMDPRGPNKFEPGTKATPQYPTRGQTPYGTYQNPNT